MSPTDIVIATQTGTHKIRLLKSAPIDKEAPSRKNLTYHPKYVSG